MVPMIVPDRYGISRRLTQYDRDVLHSTAVELLTVPLLGSAKRDVLKYCRLIWSIPVNKHYLTKRQVVALSFILQLGIKQITELSRAGRIAECTDLSEALTNLPLFVHQNMEWEEVIEPLQKYEDKHPETAIRLSPVLINVRDKQGSY